MSAVDDTVAIILSGADPDALGPLTERRAKPAVPFGGSYRLIDFTLSNCVHSGLRRIWVLTRFNSLSLQTHLRDGWSVFYPELGEFITPVPPQSEAVTEGMGSASELAQNLKLLDRAEASYVMVTYGDHVYRMDYAAMLNFHIRKSADVTVAGLEVNGYGHGNARSMVQLGAADRVVDILPLGNPGDRPENALASIDVFVFNRDFLKQRLAISDPADPSLSLTNDVLRSVIDSHDVYAYRFGGKVGRVTPDHYWRNLTGVDAYYAANMDLLKLEPPLDLYQADWPIRSYQPQCPPAKTTPGTSSNEGIAVNSIMAGGVLIAGGGVNHSILCHNVRVDDAATVEEAILMSGVVVGRGAQLRNCIVDKQVHVPPGEQIGFDADADRERFYVTEAGIVVVPQGYEFPAQVAKRSASA